MAIRVLVYLFLLCGALNCKPRLPQSDLSVSGGQSYAPIDGVVAIEVVRGDNEVVASCTASFVGTNVLLTAAHCFPPFIDRQPNYSLRALSLNAKSDAQQAVSVDEGHEAKPKENPFLFNYTFLRLRLERHKRHSFESSLPCQQYDLAIVKLPDPIANAFLDISMELPTNNSSVILAGYGGAEWRSQDGFGQFHQGNQTYVQYASNPLNYVIYKGAGATPGDSGGPLFNSKDQMIGVVESSLVLPDGPVNSYTRLSLADNLNFLRDAKFKYQADVNLGCCTCMVGERYPRPESFWIPQARGSKAPSCELLHSGRYASKNGPIKNCSASKQCQAPSDLYPYMEQELARTVDTARTPQERRQAPDFVRDASYFSSLCETRNALAYAKQIKTERKEDFELQISLAVASGDIGLAMRLLEKAKVQHGHIDKDIEVYENMDVIPEQKLFALVELAYLRDADYKARVAMLLLQKDVFVEDAEKLASQALAESKDMSYTAHSVMQVIKTREGDMIGAESHAERLRLANLHFVIKHPAYKEFQDFFKLVPPTYKF